MRLLATETHFDSENTRFFNTLCQITCRSRAYTGLVDIVLLTAKVLAVNCISRVHMRPKDSAQSLEQR